MPRFYPAKRRKWVTLPYSLYNAVLLAWGCRVELDEQSKRRLQSIPKGAGLIIVSNHTDEMDIRVLLEAARQSQRKFLFMVNQEAFEEMRGFAGFWLQRIGCFSVDRGAGDAESRQYALEIIKRCRESLVMFPEGEILYLNDHVQAFKTGAVYLGFEALRAMRETDPDAAVYILPLSLKYRYEEPVGHVLKERLEKLETILQVKPRTAKIQERLNHLIGHVMARHRMTEMSRELALRWAKFGEEIHAWRLRVLTGLERKYIQLWEQPSRQLMDRANRLASGIRKKIDEHPQADSAQLRELRRDLETLKKTIWFAGWAPQYHMEKPTAERLAESVLKLEREILGIRRPKALGLRAVKVRAGEPIPLRLFHEEYAKDSREACRRVTDYLRRTIQCLVQESAPPVIDEILYSSMKPEIMNLHVMSEDGQKVYIDHYKCGHDKAVIIAPGFFNSKSAVLLKELASFLSPYYDTVVMDFRGHGQSPGLFYWTAKEYLDLKAVIAYLKKDYAAVGLIGFSLGAATSIITASMPGVDVQSVIAVSPPTEFEKIEYRFWELEPDHDIFYNLVGEGRYGKGVRPGPFWLKKDKPIHCVGKIKAPILFLHGTKDWLIKPAHSARLFEAAQGKKRLELIEGGPHAEYLILKNREPTLKHILNWLDETLG